MRAPDPSSKEILFAIRAGTLKALVLLNKPYLTCQEAGLLLGMSTSFVRQELRKHIPVHYLQPPNARNRRSRIVFARKDIDSWVEKNSGPSLDVKRHLDGFFEKILRLKKINDGKTSA